MRLIYGICMVLFSCKSVRSSKIKIIDSIKKENILQDGPGHQLHQVASSKYYHISLTHEGNWYDALQYCRLQNMHLLSLDSPMEEDTFTAVLYDTLKSNNIFWFWTSGTKATKWMWMTSGNLIDGTRWSDNDNKANEANEADLCLALKYNAAPQGSLEWTKQVCSQSDKFKAHPICEMNAVANDAQTNGKFGLHVKDLQRLIGVFGWFVSAGFILSLINIVKVLLEDVGCPRSGWIYLLSAVLVYFTIMSDTHV